MTERHHDSAISKHSQLLPSLEAQLSRDHVAARLSGKALRVQLHGLRGLRAAGLLGGYQSSERSASHSSGLSAASTSTAAGPAYTEPQAMRGTDGSQSSVRPGDGGLSLFIKIGRVVLEKPLPLPPATK